MSKLNIDTQTVLQLFGDNKSDFLIPDYQRPYAWGEAEWQTLWNDIFSFAFPDDNYQNFKGDEEYFLGPIVTFRNKQDKLEIIDGQQRLTTLMILLRVFYSRLVNMKDTNSVRTKEDVAKCIWKTDEFGAPLMTELKIDSEVSSDDDKGEFLSILRNGTVSSGMNSRYAKAYQYFEEQIEDFLNKFPSYFPYLPTRIMKNCILLPIEAESQDTALRIFSTLNDRGKPLSDTDIFKAQFYKYYTELNRKEEFIQRWKDLDALCNEIFPSDFQTPMDELFTRYMYYKRAQEGNKQTTTEALRKFYERNEYALLKRQETLCDLEQLASFWQKVITQDNSEFSDRILKQFGVLQYAPNSMWTYMVSVYFMQNRNSENRLADEDALWQFLEKTTAFVLAYSFLRPGVNALRTPAYAEMINIVNGKTVEFKDYEFDRPILKSAIANYEFTNNRPITKSMLAWWMYRNPDQKIVPTDTVLEIEHIYPRKRQENEHGLLDSRNLESLGNKALLERSINIRASDYRFADKKKYYTGFTADKGKIKQATINAELREMGEGTLDFTEENIVSRKKSMIDSFLKWIDGNGLLK